MRLLTSGLIALALAASGCATAFTGSAYIDGGAAGCRAKCTEWDLDFGGMIAMGEYSDACICVPRESTRADTKAAAAAAGSAVGVVLQTRESERRSRHF
jgi:hypothetical protein